MGLCIAFQEFLVSFLVKYAKFTDKNAYKASITATYCTAIIAAVGGYVAAAHALIDGLVYAMPASMAGAWGWVMPANTSICLQALMGCYLLRFFTKQYFKLFEARHRAAISV